jgi:hypothetical protein
VNGNVYAATASAGYTGGPGGPIGGGAPENNSRTDISGGGKRDAALAIYGRLVPEPTTFVLFGLGLVGLVASRRRGC